MQSFPRLFLIAGCTALALGAEAQEKSGKPKKEKETSPAKSSAKEEKKAPERMPFPLAEGHGGKGLTIPYLDGDARETMKWVVGTAKRTDADHIQMGEVDIVTYDDAGKPEMEILLPKSILNLVTRKITADKKVTIRRDDFELTGNRMEFDTVAKTGTLKGNVHMVIHNLANEIKPAPPARPKQEAKPGE